jgi:hypothetical protein
MLRKLALAAAAVLVAGTAQAATLLYDNGPATQQATRVSCAETTCSGGVSWMIATPFTLGSDAMITEIHYNTGSSATPSSTIWAIYTSSPTVSTVPAYMGQTATLVSSAVFGQTVALTGYALDLTAGTYWFGFSNVGAGFVRYGAIATGADSYQLYGSTTDYGSINGGTILTASLQVYGDLSAAVVPEPAAMLLLGVGVLGLATAALSRPRGCPQRGPAGP